MPINRYCWRCKCVIPMLTDEEWKIVEPTVSLKNIKETREKYNCSLSEVGKYLCVTYNQITGSNVANVNFIWHHVASQYGDDCAKCGKPYRTKQARYCAECGDGIEKVSGNK